MFRLSRPFQAILLSALLLLTGQSVAVARGAMAATGQMVICTGTGPVTILVDAQGNPTSAPHVCPDCVLTLEADASLVFEVIERRTSHAVYVGLEDTVLRKPFTRLGYRPRAPPIGV